MGSTNLPLQNKGIYHNLPTFPPEIQDLTAVIAGANGISGFNTLRVLLESPLRWKKVWTLSRHPPPAEMMSLLTNEQRVCVEHVPVDFLQGPQSIADALSKKGVTADVVFFYSYMQPKPDAGQKVWSNADALVQVNGVLLQNFLDALKLASIVPRRILLQTGAKNYGGHLGTTLTPMVESAPRVTIEPNFYYAQEDILFKYCAETGVKWNVMRPSWIVGPVIDAAMDAYRGYAIYAAVQAQLGKRLDFPADMTAWLHDGSVSSATLTGYMSEWAVLEKACENQAFNASDSGSFSLASFWPELGRWFGVAEIGRPELDESRLHTIQMSRHPPPIGYGPQPRLQVSWTFVDWAHKPENRQAWKQLMEQHNLTRDPFEDPEANFSFSDVAVHNGPARLSPNKARLLGWNGFVDTTESLFETYQLMSKLCLLPPMIVDQFATIKKDRD